MEVVVRNRTIEDIPVLEVHQKDEESKKPLVLLYHGYLGRKEFILPQAYHLAAKGFFVVVPDAYGHGERSGNSLVDLMTAIVKTVPDINKLIESYKDSDYADYTRAGLAGYSMGGCITFHYLVSCDKKIKAAVPVISTPDWVSIADRFNTPEKISELKALGIIKHDEDILELRNLAEKIQPINNYMQMKDTPLLMLCGEKDEVTPCHGVERLYELLEPLYHNKESLRYIIYPGVGHGDTVEMNFELADWMKKFLV